MGLGAALVRVAVAPVQVSLVAVGLPILAYDAARRGVREAVRGVEAGRVAVGRAAALLDATEALVVGVAATTEHADRVATAAGVVAAEAGDAVAAARAELELAGRLLEAHAPALARLVPVTDRAARTLDARHVDAVVQLLDLGPEILDLITPALRGMGELGPGLGQLTDRLDTVGQIVEGLPGAGLLKRRGAETDD